MVVVVVEVVVVGSEVVVVDARTSVVVVVPAVVKVPEVTLVVVEVERATVVVGASLLTADATRRARPNAVATTIVMTTMRFISESETGDGVRRQDAVSEVVDGYAIVRAEPEGGGLGQTGGNAAGSVSVAPKWSQPERTTLGIEPGLRS